MQAGMYKCWLICIIEGRYLLILSDVFIDNTVILVLTYIASHIVKPCLKDLMP